MKVFYISNAAIPSFTANSMQIMKMCQAFVSNGYDVELIAPQMTVSPQLKHVDLWTHYGIRKSFPIRHIPCKKAIGLHVYSFIAVLRALASKADMIFTRNLEVAAIAVCAGIPTICELHQMPGGRGGPYYLRCISFNIKNAKVLVAITNRLKEDLISCYPETLKKIKIVVASDGVDMKQFENPPDVFTARRKLGIEVEGFVAGYSGSFYSGKGINVVVELACRCPHIHFMVMGGDYQDILRQKDKLRKDGITNISFQGFISNSKLPTYLAACNVLLLPNQRKVAGSGGGDIGKWTSPLKLFEYMASSRLIIASDLPVLREILSSNNALLCDPENLSEWESAINMASLDNKLRRDLADRTRDQAKKYDWTFRVERCLQALYKKRKH